MKETSPWYLCVLGDEIYFNTALSSGLFGVVDADREKMVGRLNTTVGKASEGVQLRTLGG